MRKVLSYVLILALVLSSFSMAFAGSATELKTLSDVEGNANQEAIEVAYDLGIVTGNPDGTFQPTKAVTRAEFAAMITRALAIPESALAGYAKTNFKDTTGYTWAVPYLAFCNSKGIMLGDGQGNAMPGRTITLNEAITMVLRALGYTNNSAKLQGAWPSNYVTLAQELNLYDDVAKNLEGVDKANAAQIIYNALKQDKVSVNSDGETNPTGTTLLTAGLNCTADDNAVVDNADFSDSLINMAKYIGQFGTIYRNDDGEVVAFMSDCDMLVGRFTADDKFVTTDEEKEYSIKVANEGTHLVVDGLDYLVNGNDVANYNSVDGMVTAKDGGKYGYLDGSKEFAIAVDLSGKTIKDIYAVTEWTVTDADQVSKEDLDAIKDDHKLLGGEFVEEDNDEIDYTQFQLVGASSISNIKADDVVYIYADGKDIRKIEVGTKTVEGTVKTYKIAKKDAAAKIAVGSETLKNASDVINGANGYATAITDGEVGDEIKIVLDARGYVYDFDNTSTSTNFAVVEGAEPGAVRNEAKLLLADGSEKAFTYDFDGAKVLDNVDTGHKTQSAIEDLTGGSIIGYGLDKNGEISKTNLFYAQADSIVLGSKNLIKNITNIGAAYSGTAIGGSDTDLVAAINVTNAKIDSNCVVFTYKDDGGKVAATATKWDVSSLDKVEIGDRIDDVVLLFKEDKKKLGGYDNSKVVAMLLPESMAKSGTEQYAVLNEIFSADSDGDKVWQVKGFLDGKKMDALTDDDAYLAGNETPVHVADGDYTAVNTVELYQVKVDANGVITDMVSLGNTTTGDGGAYDDVICIDVVTKADGRKSVAGTTAAGGPVSDTDGVTPVTTFAISDKAVIYSVNSSDEYVVESGKIKEGYGVVLYETDDDEDGYDVVIIWHK